MESRIMMPTLFFLLAIIMLGTGAYVYLHRKQDELFPKDKYDEAWDQLYNKRKPKRLIALTESSYLLIKTFWIALFVNSIIVSIKFTQPFNIKEFLFAFLAAILLSPLFPLGLNVFVYNFVISLSPLPALDPFIKNAISRFIILILYLIYPAIFLLGIYVKNRRVFSYIYIALIILLILNISGCALIITPDFLSGLN